LVAPSLLGIAIFIPLKKVKNSYSPSKNSIFQKNHYYFFFLDT